MNELQESLNALTWVMTQVAKKIDILVQSMDMIAVSLSDTMKTMDIVAHALDQLRPAVATLTQTIKDKAIGAKKAKKPQKPQQGTGPMAVIGQIQRVVAVTEQWVRALNPALIEQFGRAIADLQATAGTAFTSIFAEGIGFFRRMAGVVAPVFTQLAPIVEQIVSVAFKALAAGVQVVVPIFEALIPIVRSLSIVLGVMSSVSRLYLTVMALLIQVAAMGWSFLATAFNALAPVFRLLNTYLDGLSRAFQAYALVIAAFGDVITGILEELLGFNLDELVKKINDAFKDLIKAIITTAVKIAYLIDQALGDKFAAAIMKRLKGGTGATAAGGTAIKNLESIGKDFALAAANAAEAKSGESTEEWQKEVAALLGDIRENTKDARQGAKERLDSFIPELPRPWDRGLAGSLLLGGVGGYFANRMRNAVGGG